MKLLIALGAVCWLAGCAPQSRQDRVEQWCQTQDRYCLRYYAEHPNIPPPPVSEAHSQAATAPAYDPDYAARLNATANLINAMRPAPYVVPAPLPPPQQYQPTNRVYSCFNNNGIVTCN
jgi:hypothetical protein